MADWPDDVDEMTALYDSEISAQLDGILRMRQFVRQQRPSDPWLDKDCRAAKRLTRRLERVYSAASRWATAATASASSDAADAVAKADAAKAAWLNQRRVHRQLRHTKSAEYWNDKVEANQSDPHKLWQLVEDLLGRGRTPVNSVVPIEVFNRFYPRGASDARVLAVIVCLRRCRRVSQFSFCSMAETLDVRR